MAPHISPRSLPTTSNAFAGGLIGGFILLVLILCLLCHFCLRRSPASAPQGGVTQPGMRELDPASKNMPSHLFSRQRLRASTIMPEKTITRKQPAQTSSWHDLPGLVTPSPSQYQSLGPGSSSTSSPAPHRPLSKISLGSPRPRSMSLLNPACSRQSRASAGLSIYDQLNHPPSPKSRRSSARSTSPTHVARPVRQAFEPALADELAIHRGEYLTLIESFDDGWCLVAREAGRRASRASRLSSWIKGKERDDKDGKSKAVAPEDVDIGLVPAWVFIKPLHGVTVTRPFRSSSVSALQLSPPDGDATRNAIISWSNFS